MKSVKMIGAAMLLLGGLALGAVTLGGPEAREAGAPVVRPQAEASGDLAEYEAGGFIISTMSFDTRVPDYSKLATIEPGLPIKDYFHEFFPLSCETREAYNALSVVEGEWIKDRFRDQASQLTTIAYYGHTACETQVAVICDPNEGHSSFGTPLPVNQGILLRTLTDDLRLSCGIVTTAHSWAGITANASESGELVVCATTKDPAQQTSDLIARVSGDSVSMALYQVQNAGGRDTSALRGSLGIRIPGIEHQYTESFDPSRVSLVHEATRNGMFGSTGSLSTDLEYESININNCFRSDDHDRTLRLPRFEDIRALTSVSALRSTCDLGVMICASPPSGQAADQKRCTHYLPEELGAEGDVYDFRSLVNGKGIVRHYGTSFKGLSGAGHYCMRRGYEPIPFGMSVAVRSNPETVDRETYNQWLNLYIMQGSRERGEYVVVQHLANLADFEEFRKHQRLD